MAPERSLNQQRIEAELSADTVARDAQVRIRAYQQRLRAGLLAAPGSAPAGGSWSILAPLRKVWGAIVRAMP